ncbi:MAG: hypothetical protein LBS76_03285 [Mycoplasmataceae bacterium]|jgi:PHD/YefM family antitoxin component YafN of YafNO toxin-antitoxin module|nr:hypothetical protein [Mycoplasmataceae bacterium]
MLIRPSSQVQRNMDKLVLESKNAKAPIYLTKNGSGYAILMELRAFEEQYLNELPDFIYQNIQDQLKEYMELRKTGKAKYYSKEEAMEGVRNIAKKYGHKI